MTEQERITETFEAFRETLRAFVDLSVREDDGSFGALLSSFAKNIDLRCWEKKECDKNHCPAYHNLSGRCWLIAGTMCAGQVPTGEFAQKYQSCQDCDVYHDAVYKDALTETEEHLIVLVHSLRTKQNALQEMATTDFLTGLHNRRYFDLFIHREIKRARRTGEKLTFVMIDINGFKRINDTHGHLHGDNMLKACAELLTETVRESDLVIRHGGDEFLLFLHDGGPTQVRAFIRRLREREQEWNCHRPAGCSELSLSIGAAVMAGDEELATILAEADRNMYADKERSKQGLPPFSPEATLSSTGATALPAAITALPGRRFPHGEAIPAAENVDAREEGTEASFPWAARSLRLLTRCLRELVRAEDEQELLGRVCRTIVEKAGYALAWVGYAEQDEARSVRPVAHAGFEEGYLESMGITWADTERGRGPTGVAIREERSCVFQNILTNPNFIPWREDAERRGYAASVALPLRAEGKVFGALSIYAGEPEAFSIAELEFLRELADDLAFGIVAVRRRTEHQGLTEALRQSDIHYRTLMNSMAVAVTLIDAEFRVVMANTMTGRYLGKDPAALIGRHCFREFEKREKVCPHCPGRVAMATGSTAEVETEGVRDDGRRFLVRIKATPLFGKDGRPSGFIEVAEDITERKRAEDALRQSEAQYRTLVENLEEKNFLFSHDQEGMVTYLSPSFTKILGHAPTTDITHITAYLTDHPDNAEAARRTELILKGNRQPPYEVEVYHHDGSCRWLEISKTPVLSSEGLVTGVHGIARDITNRKETEAEQARLREQLNQARTMEVIGRLAGGIAHEYNNMFGIILGYAQLLQNPASDSLIEGLQAIEQAARRAKEINRQLLAYAGKQVIAPQSLALNDTLQELREVLAHFLGEAITLAFRLAPDLGLIRMDPTQMDQILLNLAANARDAMSDGGVALFATGNTHLDPAYCRVHPEISPGPYVTLRVTDTGCGMDQETLTHIFEPFFTTKGVGRGTGLGLATIYGIIKQNGGHIEAASAPGRGSSFTLYFPQRPAAADCPEDRD